MGVRYFGTKNFGGSRWGGVFAIIGASRAPSSARAFGYGLGAIPGTVMGAFLGALAVELVRQRHAGKAAWAARRGRPRPGLRPLRQARRRRPLPRPTLHAHALDALLTGFPSFLEWQPCGLIASPSLKSRPAPVTLTLRRDHGGRGPK